MSRKFGTGAADFLQGPPKPVVWHLDVQEDANDRGMFLPDHADQPPRNPSAHLANYISAGGMRALRPTHRADMDAALRLCAIRFALLLLALWVIFYFVPCG